MGVSCLVLLSLVQPASKDLTGEEFLRDRLESIGFDPRLSRRIAASYGPAVGVWRVIDASEVDRRIAAWKGLASEPVVRRALLEHPEAASLFAGADDAGRVAATFLAANGRVAVRAHEVLPDWSPDRVTAVLEHHAGDLGPLAKSPESLPQAVKILEALGPGGRAADWFADAVARLDPAERLVWLAVVDRDIVELRDAFADESRAIRSEAAWGRWVRFRASLAADDWRRHERLTRQLGYVRPSRLLAFFERDDAETLFRRGGVAAFWLLTTPVGEAGGVRREDVREALPGLLLRGDAESVTTAVALSNSPDLAPLLRRPLTPTALKAALTSAAREPGLLRRVRGMSDTALAQEVGAESLGVVEYLPFGEPVAKLCYGRGLNGVDAVFIVLDAATIMIPVKAGPVLKQVGKATATTAAKEAGKSTAKAAAKRTMTELLMEAPEAVAKAASRTLTTSFDVTEAVRAVWKATGRPTKQMKRLADLDARVFMRADRRVMVCPAAFLDTPAGIAVRETFENAAAEPLLGPVVPEVLAALEELRQAARRMGRTPEDHAAATSRAALFFLNQGDPAAFTKGTGRGAENQE